MLRIERDRQTKMSEGESNGNEQRGPGTVAQLKDTDVAQSSKGFALPSRYAESKKNHSRDQTANRN